MPTPPPPLPHQIESVDASLWAVEQHRYLYGVHFRNRMTIVRLSVGPGAGRLWVHSPVSIDDELAKAIAEIGEVAYIVAPNQAHYLWLDEARARWPEAEVWVSPGLGDKLAAKGMRSDGLHDLPTEPAELAWGGDLDQRFIPGNARLRETLFLHRQSRSLIVCDFVMNVVEEPRRVARWAWRALGLYRGLRQSRPWRKWFTKDPAAQAPVVAQVLNWDFDRIIPTHGDVYEGDAREALRQATDWLREHEATSEHASLADSA